MAKYYRLPKNVLDEITKSRTRYGEKVHSKFSWEDGEGKTRTLVNIYGGTETVFGQITSNNYQYFKDEGENFFDPSKVIYKIDGAGTLGYIPINISNMKNEAEEVEVKCEEICKIFDQPDLYFDVTNNVLFGKNKIKSINKVIDFIKEGVVTICGQSMLKKNNTCIGISSRNTWGHFGDWPDFIYKKDESKGVWSKTSITSIKELSDIVEMAREINSTSGLAISLSDALTTFETLRDKGFYDGVLSLVKKPINKPSNNVLPNITILDFDKEEFSEAGKNPCVIIGLTPVGSSAAKKSLKSLMVSMNPKIIPLMETISYESDIVSLSNKFNEDIRYIDATEQDISKSIKLIEKLKSSAEYALGLRLKHGKYEFNKVMNINENINVEMSTGCLYLPVAGSSTNIGVINFKFTRLKDLEDNYISISEAGLSSLKFMNTYNEDIDNFLKTIISDLDFKENVIQQYNQFSDFWKFSSDNEDHGNFLGFLEYKFWRDILKGSYIFECNNVKLSYIFKTYCDDIASTVIYNYLEEVLKYNPETEKEVNRLGSIAINSVEEYNDLLSKTPGKTSIILSKDLIDHVDIKSIYSIGITKITIE